jgi:hypothetical protein
MVAAPKRRKTGPEKAAKSKVRANVEHVVAHQETQATLGNPKNALLTM